MGYTLPNELMFLKNAMVTQKKSSALMTGKVCVITGATSGVGLETLKQLSMGGAHSVVVCRNRLKAEEIIAEIKSQYDVNIDIVIADFTSLEDVRIAAAHILKTYPKIDVLINSAGIHSTTKTYTKEGLETVFCVNHLAPFLFTQLLMDRLKESAPARILQVNSEGHRFNGLKLDDLNWNKRVYTGLRGYGASKTAQLLTVWELADELQGSGVTINAVHPGEVKSNIGHNNGWFYRFFLHNVTWHFLKEPVVSGESIYYLAADPKIEGVNGKFFNLTVEEVPASHATNRRIGKQVFEKSKQLVGLKKICL